MPDGLAYYYIGNDLTKLFSFVEKFAPRGTHPIPLYKILCTMHRKGYCTTVAVDSNARSTQFEHECSLQSSYNESDLTRLHFFKTKISDSNVELSEEDVYGGFCDLRPDCTISGAFINARTVVNTGFGGGGYAYLPVQEIREVELPAEIGGGLIRIRGFSYMQKNGRETMCSQAALDGVVRYWQTRWPGCFAGIHSTININEAAGIKRKSQVGVLKHGLNMGQIVNLPSPGDGLTCQFEEVPSVTPESSSRRADAIENIYGFVEAGFPVIAAAAFSNEGRGDNNDVHALTILGHTFDRNNWEAMAELEYFLSESTDQKYHRNTTWIHHFIIHDDNFGPYYFLRSEKLRKALLGWAVLVPDTTNFSDMVLPSEATGFAADFLLPADIHDYLSAATKHPDMLPENKDWLERFRSHLRLDAGDGLVLRPILRSRDNILEQYQNHELLSDFEKILSKGGDTLWVVELSWPDIYCFHNASCGELFMSMQGEPLALHIPGQLINLSPHTGRYVTQHVDGARQHHQPGIVPRAS